MKKRAEEKVSFDFKTKEDCEKYTYVSAWYRKSSSVEQCSWYSLGRVSIAISSFLFFTFFCIHDDAHMYAAESGEAEKLAAAGWEGGKSDSALFLLFRYFLSAWHYALTAAEYRFLRPTCENCAFCVFFLLLRFNFEHMIITYWEFFPSVRRTFAKK